ncbi:putative sulfate transporter 4 [Arachis hypogaea]|nr:putative sulfate transporter 4 [Arachis hypogaea]
MRVVMVVTLSAPRMILMNSLLTQSYHKTSSRLACQFTTSLGFIESPFVRYVKQEFRLWIRSLLVYGLFGSSRQLAIGLVALVSLLRSNVLNSIADPSSKLYTAGNTIGSYG